MKRSIAILASAAAAAAAAFASAKDHNIHLKASSISTDKISESSKTESADEAFAARFDGQRFIETLVTAHR